MGRKFDVRKIEDLTKCQVTFSKRRGSLFKKANEIAVFCNVDVAIVMFSPSSRISKFCNRERIEDVIGRYANLAADKRLVHIKNVERKMEKVKQLECIKGNINKLRYLDKQIENLELQMTKTNLEMQILVAGLRDYEVVPGGQGPSPYQLWWCERNLNLSMQKLIARKKELIRRSDASSNSEEQQGFQAQTSVVDVINNMMGGEEQECATAPIPPTHVLMQLDPWISPYSTRVRERILEGLINQSNCTYTSTIQYLNPHQQLSYNNYYNNNDHHQLMTTYNNVPPAAPSLTTSYTTCQPQDNDQHQPLSLVDIDQTSNSDNISMAATCWWDDATDQMLDDLRVTSGSGNASNGKMVKSSMDVMSYQFPENELMNMDIHSQRMMTDGDDVDSEISEMIHELLVTSTDQDTPLCEPHLLVQAQDTKEDDNNAPWSSISKVLKAGLWEWDDMLLTSFNDQYIYIYNSNN